MAALPPGKSHGPAETVFLAPEIFLGPFASPISDGTRVAGGVFFNLEGDRVRDRTYTVTVAFDILRPPAGVGMQTVRSFPASR
jgi:hypothetical protein